MTAFILFCRKQHSNAKRGVFFQRKSIFYTQRGILYFKSSIYFNYLIGNSSISIVQHPKLLAGFANIKTVNFLFLWPGACEFCPWARQETNCIYVSKLGEITLFWSLNAKSKLTSANSCSIQSTISTFTLRLSCSSETAVLICTPPPPLLFIIPYPVMELESLFTFSSYLTWS